MKPRMYIQDGKNVPFFEDGTPRVRFDDEEMQAAMIEERARCAEIYAHEMGLMGASLVRAGMLPEEAYAAGMRGARAAFKHKADDAFQVVVSPDKLRYIGRE